MPNRQEILKTSRKHFSTTVLLTSQMLFYYAKHDDNDDGSELLVLKLLNFFLGLMLMLTIPRHALWAAEDGTMLGNRNETKI